MMYQVKIFISWHDMLCTLLYRASYIIRMNPEEFATCILRVNCPALKMVSAGSSTIQQCVVSQTTVIYIHITIRTSSISKCQVTLLHLESAHNTSHIYNSWSLFKFQHCGNTKNSMEREGWVLIEYSSKLQVQAVACEKNQLTSWFRHC
jgi:hypothetical protein